VIVPVDHIANELSRAAAVCRHCGELDGLVLVAGDFVCRDERLCEWRRKRRPA
jgi:hypothetical protein